MKTNFGNRNQERASVLAVGLVIGIILCIALISYLSLVHQQNLTVARAQAWNEALALAEAGVEESLAQLNPGALVTNILQNNGWSVSDGFYRPGTAKRDLGSGYFFASYTPTPPPVIYSTGYATIPAMNMTVQRTVEVKTTNASLFSVGMVAREDIRFNGNGLTTDSYDSADPAHSDNGMYDSGEKLHNGDVASIYGKVDLGNHTIDGSLYLGASATWDNSGTITGSKITDYNLEFPDVNPPFDPGSAQTPQAGNGKNNQHQYIIGQGNYYLPSVSVANGKDIYVTSPEAVLYVGGNFDSQNGAITLAPGAKLMLYVGGATTKLGSVNNTNTAKSFQYYGLSSNTSITMSGNSMFVGTIYAPNADFTGNGSGNNILDIQGGMIVQSVTMNGNFAFHFDEDLRRGIPPRGYVAISWREL